MGITGLNNFLKTHYAQVYEDSHLAYFSYKKVAFDISSYIYQNISVHGKEGWLNAFVRLMCLFRQYAVHVIPVFDGIAPKEKTETRQDRRDQRSKADEKCLNLSMDLESFKKSGIISPLLEEISNQINTKQYNESLSHKRLLPTKVAQTVKPKTEIDVKAIEEYISSREQNIFNIEQEDIDQLKALLNILKIPFIQATAESESLCCYLNNIGRADAVFSLDSDCLAYKAPVIINKLSFHTGECIVLRTETVIKELGLADPNHLTLFCILCGTDYNKHTKNIKGVGPVKALKMVKQWGSYEKITKNEKAFENIEDDGLRYENNMALFNEKYPDQDKADMLWNIRGINMDDVEKYFKNNKITANMDYIRQLWKPAQVQFEDN